MADGFEGFIITNGGLNLLAKAISGKRLQFTRVGLGDSESGGVVVTISATDAPDMTDLVHWQKDMPIVDDPVVSGGIASITYMVQNAGVTEGFWLCETGIYALDPDTGNEILYAYENRGIKGGWLPPMGSNTVWQQRMIAEIIVGNATNITAVIDSGLIYVTQAEFQEHVNSATPHPNYSGGSSAPTIDPTVLDGINARLLQAETDIAGLNTQVTDLDAQVRAGNSRILQTETNIANLYLQLSTENDLGLTPNLMLIEDFTGESVCDTFSQPVTAAVAGTRVITLDDGTGLLSGSYYTLTDGVSSEQVQIVSIATSNGVTTVNVTTDIQNTYTIANTTLRRSTLTVGDGQAYGAGDVRAETFTFSRVWSGTSANNTATIELTTTLANKAAFELEGDYAFTSDGEFTLAS